MYFGVGFVQRNCEVLYGMLNWPDEPLTKQSKPLGKMVTFIKENVARA